MSIAALPPSTISIIGSTQVLTDAASVVKELIDNALDARASSIIIEISSNTLDVIQVRDNGHGIAPQDRSLICRRYCTSKIRNYSDLKDIGGTSLGFRGEALASAAELSGTTLITTRVEGEDVAVALKVNTKGEVDGRERASHPVGTTVRLSDLFKLLPVRKQTALKTAAKCLGRIKRIMQAYALARQSVRFSLRILKAKNEKGNWLYAPKTDATVEDAALKVVGKDCAGQCAWHSAEHEGYKIEALLPRQDADFTKINNIGQFLSVDSRPVSATRGFLKKVGVLFKDNLRGRASETTGDLKDPFLMMNIVCPPQSYDANVEPAKDDVMFENTDIVLDAVQQLLNIAYPEEAPARQATPPLFLEAVDCELERSSKRQRTLEHNMWDNDDASMLDQPHQAEDIEAEEENLRDVSVSNPWTLAKITSSTRPLQAQQYTQGVLRTLETSSPISTTHRAVLSPVRSVMKDVELPAYSPWSLPTPEHSSPPMPRRGPPARRAKRQQRPPMDPYEDNDELEDIGSFFNNELTAPRQPRIRTFQASRDASPELNPRIFNDLLRQETLPYISPILSDQSPNLPSPHPSVEPQSARAKRARTRTRSSMADLPLESVPRGYHVHDLSLTLCTSLAAVAAVAKELQLSLEAALPPLPTGVWNVLSTSDDDEEDEMGKLDQRSATSSTTSTFTDPPPSVGECNSWRESVLDFLSQQRLEDGEDGLLEDVDIAHAMTRLVEAGRCV